MRFRIAAVLVAVTALIGLSATVATVASASPHTRPAVSCGLAPGPYHLEANAATSLGLTYHGVGNQPTVTSSIGDTTLECDIPPNIYVLHNDAGNCIRITDASNDYNVIEESGCSNSQLNDSNYQWEGFPENNNRVVFENIHFPSQWLGTEHCPPRNGDGVEGVTGDGGTCPTWVLASR